MDDIFCFVLIHTIKNPQTFNIFSSSRTSDFCERSLKFNDNFPGQGHQPTVGKADPVQILLILPHNLSACDCTFTTIK